MTTVDEKWLAAMQMEIGVQLSNFQRVNIINTELEQQIALLKLENEALRKHNLELTEGREQLRAQLDQRRKNGKNAS